MAKVKAKEILINTEWCKGCNICVHFCPRKVLQLNEKEKAWVANLADCTACGLCERWCPDLAIVVVKELSEKESV